MCNELYYNLNLTFIKNMHHYFIYIFITIIGEGGVHMILRYLQLYIFTHSILAYVDYHSLWPFLS